MSAQWQFTSSGEAHCFLARWEEGADRRTPFAKESRGTAAGQLRYDHDYINPHIVFSNNATECSKAKSLSCPTLGNVGVHSDAYLLFKVCKDAAPSGGCQRGRYCASTSNNDSCAGLLDCTTVLYCITLLLSFTKALLTRLPWLLAGLGLTTTIGPVSTRVVVLLTPVPTTRSLAMRVRHVSNMQIYTSCTCSRDALRGLSWIFGGLQLFGAGSLVHELRMVACHVFPECGEVGVEPVCWRGCVRLPEIIGTGITLQRVLGFSGTRHLTPCRSITQCVYP